MTDKCPWCEADRSAEPVKRWWYDCGTNAKYSEIRAKECFRRELQRTVDDSQSMIARMQPVVDAAVAWSTLSGSRLDLLLAIEKYEESELHAR